MCRLWYRAKGDYQNGKRLNDEDISREISLPGKTNADVAAAMWLLTSLADPDQKYVLSVGRSYVAGRKGCDILVENDAAVSRRHAELIVTHTDANLSKPQCLPVVTIKDLSKYGTMVNGNKVEGEVPLCDGDEVVFGSAKSTFFAVYEPLIVSTSCLKPNLKRQVRQTMTRLGGHIVGDWSRDCTLLVMSSISVTIKVVCALVSLKPIVSPEYLDAYLAALEANTELPTADAYLPTVSESQVDPSEVTFANNPRRTTIFQGKTFIFLHEKQFQKMSLAVELGGGMPLLMDKRPERGEEGIIVHKDTVVMTCGPDEHDSPEWKEWYQYVAKSLARQKHRMSEDAELGYAVLHCDTQNYCNPCVDFASENVPRLPSQSLSQAPVYQETQKLDMEKKVKPEKVTPPPTPAKAHLSPMDNSTIFTNVRGKGSQRSNFPARGQTSSTASKATGQRSELERSQESSDRAEKSPPSKSSKSKKTEDRPPSSPPGRRLRSRSPSPSPAPQRGHRAVQSSRSSSPTSGKGQRTNLKSSSPPSPTPKRGQRANQKSRSPSPTSRKGQRSNLRSRSSSPVPQIDNPTSPEPSKAKTSGRVSGKDTVSIKTEKMSQSTKSRPGKRQIIEEDSDEDYGFTRKSKRKHSSSNEKDQANPFDLSSCKHKTSQTRGSQRRGVKAESDDGDMSDSGRDERSRSFKGRNVSISNSESDEEAKVTNKGKTPKTKGQGVRGQESTQGRDASQSANVRGQKKRKVDDVSDDDESGGLQAKIKLESGTTSQSSRRHASDEDVPCVDTSKNRLGSSGDRTRTDRQGAGTKQEKITPHKPVHKRTEEDRARCDQADQEETTPRKQRPPATGFLSAVRHHGQDDNGCHSDYVKEEDLPTDLVQTVFTDLVTRRPSCPQVTSVLTKDVAPGYSRWRDKIVKNFKKFKKANNEILDRLPNIIGGSDLVPHVASQRRELDEWFRDAQQAESQQTEADRRAQELFEWEPRSNNRNR